MNIQKHKHTLMKRRARRTRATLHGTETRPRISVHKSNVHVYVQCINDDVQKTIISASTAMKDLRTVKGKEQIQKLAKQVGEQLKEKGITTALFDRGSYRFHGVVRLIADGIKAQGIRI